MNCCCEELCELSGQPLCSTILPLSLWHAAFPVRCVHELFSRTMIRAEQGRRSHAHWADMTWPTSFTLLARLKLDLGVNGQSSGVMSKAAVKEGERRREREGEREKRTDHSSLVRVVQDVNSQTLSSYNNPILLITRGTGTTLHQDQEGEDEEEDDGEDLFDFSSNFI